MANLLLVAPLVFGGIIGLYEVILLHRDVSVPTHRFTHSITAFIFAIIATYLVMNVSFVFAKVPALANIPYMSPLVFEIIIGLIAMIKIHGASSVIKRTTGGSSVGLKETWAHSFVVAALIILSPYIYGAVAPMLPSWMAQ